MSTVVCPAGHTSVSTDYCDVCGELIGGSPAGPAPTAGGGGGGPFAGEPCPDCDTPKTDRFCEECGYDFALMQGGRAAATRVPQQAPDPAPPTMGDFGGSAPAFSPTSSPVSSAPTRGGTAPAAEWFAVVDADREYFERVLAELGPGSGLVFPPYHPERRIPLTGAQIRIGRRSSTKPAVPEIDLREPPEDPGVSHVHAVLLARPGGGWSLVDPGSRNRTCLNGSTDPVPLNVEVPVGDGDRIHVGAWTTITLQRGEAT